MSGLFLNFIEYELSEQCFNLQAVPYKNYETKEQYLDLKDTNPDFHFYRFDKDIFLWERKTGVQHKLQTSTKSVSQTDHPKIISKIVESALIDYIKSLDAYNVRYNRHGYTWELVSRTDALNGKIPGLNILRRVNISPYYFQPGGKTLHGFTISCNFKYKFTWTVGEFQSKGIDTSHLRTDEETVIPDMVSRYYFLEATGTKEIFEAEIARLESNETAFKVIKGFHNWLQNHKDDIYLPNGLKIKSFNKRYLPFNKVYREQLPKPERYFFNGATNNHGHRYYNQMVKAYKPASYGQFEDETVNIAVVFPAEYEGITEGLLNRLETFLKEELHLKRLEFHPVKIPDDSLQSYEKGIYKDSELLKKASLFLIIVNQEQEKLPPALSPYYYCKAKLLGDGIPTQDVQAETIKQRIHILTLSNLSLNIYAKLGGTAWTVEKEEKRKHELVIGIGSTTDEEGKTILGIAQIFHSDGRYIVGDCAPLSTFENYAENLEKYLYETLQEVISTHIDTSEPFRIIFHLFKSAGKDNELKAIENVMKRLSQYKFDFALLHLGYGHNFRLYHNDGKGKIYRGSYVKLTKYTALLHFVSDSDLPLKIELDKRSQGFTDLYYLSKQVYWFSSLSHRSYSPSKKTVTIMYPSLMASITEKLRKVPNWNIDRLKYVSDKLWFI